MCMEGREEEGDGGRKGEKTTLKIQISRKLTNFFEFKAENKNIKYKFLLKKKKYIYK